LPLLHADGDGAPRPRALPTGQGEAAAAPRRRGLAERVPAGLGGGAETAVHGSGGVVSASIRRRWTWVRERPTRAAPHRRSDGAPAPVAAPCRGLTPRAARGGAQRRR